MTAQTQSSESSLSFADQVKLILVIGLVAAGIIGFYYFSEVSLFYRVLAMVGVALVASGIFFSTSLGRDLWAFMQEARMEVRKVAWPTRQETLHTTLMVFVMVFVMGLILWMLDTLFLWLVRLLTGQGA